jgi:hypothetical protein
MTAATIRSELVRAVEAAKAAVEKSPRPETYRALLEAQSELQRHDLQYSRKTLRGAPPATRGPGRRSGLSGRT